MRSHSTLVASQGDRADGSEADAGRLGGGPVPELAGPESELELLAGGAAAHPHQAEVAHRCPARFGIGFEVDDLPATSARLDGVHGAHNAAPDHDGSFGAHARAIVVRDCVPRPFQVGWGLNPTTAGRIARWQQVRRGLAETRPRVVG